MSNIDEFDATDTTFLHLKSPRDDEPLFATVGGVQIPIGITFHAPGSDAYVAADKKNTNRSLARGKRKIPMTADLLHADRIAFLTDITAAFEQITSAVAPDATGPALFTAIYADPKKAWIIEQANTHLADWSHFTRASPTT